MGKTHSPAAAAIGGLLVLFGARRLLLVSAAVAKPRPLPRAGPLPSVAFVIAARDEEASLPGLLAALDALEYPAEELFTVIVDDGSADSTAGALARWSGGRPRTRVVTMPSPVGKASALNAGIDAAPPSDAVVVCDADFAPEPRCLLELVRPLADPSVGGVAGYLYPANASASPVARYAAVERWLMQLVTSAGKDRLGLDPPALGGLAAFRRRALSEVGGFAAGVPGEDLVATVALARRGWRTRFAPGSVASGKVVDNLGDYWRQHTRWQGSAFEAGRAAGLGAGSPLRRLETWLLAAGYADRVVLAAAVAFAAARRLPASLPAAYLGLRAVEVAVVLGKARAGREAPAYLFWTVALFPVDLAASAAGLARSLRRRSGAWQSPRAAAHA